MPSLPKGNRPTLAVSARSTYIKAKQEAFKGMDKSNRSTYNSRRWRKLRLTILRANPICTMCLQKDRYTTANVVDHIEPINKGGATWNVDNLQALCTPCHNSKSATDRVGRAI